MTDQNQLDQTPLTDAELDLLFDSARTQDAPISDTLMARILTDAHRVTEVHTPKPVPSRARLVAFVRDIFGGWRSFAGLTATGCAGVVIGLWAPDLVSGLIEQAALTSDVYVEDYISGLSGVLNDG